MNDVYQNLSNIEIEKNPMHSDEMTLNMGPQHPSTHGVLRVVLKTDGEIIKDAKPVIGYLHRCFEKHAENIQWPMVLPFTDRLDYIASMNNNFGYVIGVEKLMGIEVNERVEYLRIITAELNRIASHLIALGTFGLDLGAFTPFLYVFREREHILDLFEELCGARLLYNYMWIGGLSHDAPDGWTQKVLDFCDYFEPKVEDYNKDVPYSLYDRFDFNTVVGKGEKGTVGDTWDRYWVRVEEMLESIKIVRQAAKDLPDGDVKEKIPKMVKVPKGEIYIRTETPRGELGYFIVSENGKIPYRVKVRSPAFCNLSVLQAISPGVMIADFVAILGSLDIVLGEIDK